MSILRLKNGVKRENCFIIKDGDEMVIDERGIEHAPLHEIKRLYIDSDTGQLVNKSFVKGRGVAAAHGLSL